MGLPRSDRSPDVTDAWACSASVNQPENAGSKTSTCSMSRSFSMSEDRSASSRENSREVRV